MPRHFVVLVAFVLLVSLPQARAQHHPHNDPAAAHFSWHNVPTDVRAIAAANIITMSCSPLGTGLVNLATGSQIEPNSISAATPMPCNPASPGFTQGMGGGSLPQDFFKPQPSQGGGRGSSRGGSGGGSGGSGQSGNASGNAALTTPDIGWWEVPPGPGNAEVPAGVPVSIGPTVDTPEPGTLILGGFGLAAVMGWRARRKKVTSTPHPSESV